MDSVPDISLSPESPAHGLEIPLISLVGSGQQSGGQHSGSSGDDADSVPVTSLSSVPVMSLSPAHCLLSGQLLN